MDYKICIECQNKISPDIPFCPYCGSKQTRFSENDLNKNPFDILQVSQNAEYEVIEAAYKSLAKKYHPDVDSSEEALLKMQDINWAYGILKNEKNKKEWISQYKSSQSSKTDESIKNKDDQAHQAEKQKSITSCSKCGAQYTSTNGSCPICKVNERENRTRRIKNGIGLSFLLVMVCLLITPAILSAIDSGHASSSTTNKPVSTNNGNYSKTHQVATNIEATRQYAAIQLTKKVKATADAKSTLSAKSGLLSGSCIRWSQVSSLYVGKIVCVYGQVVKVMHNDYNNGTREYVVRFSPSNDYFLVKSENYWWPDLEVGQCWAFTGVIQESPNYYYMQMIEQNDVMGKHYSGCD